MMTPDELRTDIAIALGWRLRSLNTDKVTVRGPHIILIAPDGTEIRGNFFSPRLALLSSHIPDWPNDTGAALELCVGIGRERQWSLVLTPTMRGERRRFFAFFESEDYVSMVSACYGDLPGALSRLALKALQKEDV